MKYLDGIPPEVAELIKPYLDPEPETLASIAVALCTKRDAAMLARTSSGIETLWSDAEDAYIGIDDANRSEFEGGKWAKPMAMNGPVQAGTTVKGKADYKSTVFLRLTARYVEAGAAKLAEILLPADDKAFSIKGTPLPELVKAKKDNSQVVNNAGVPLTRPAQPNEISPPATPTTGAAATAVSTTPAPQPVPTAAPGGAVQPGAAGAPPDPTAVNAAPPPPRVPLTVADLAKENMQLANGKAKLAETRIYDWLVESFYSTNMRKVIFDAARLGSGVLKGPHPKVSDAIMTNASKEDGEGVSVKIKREIKPGVSYVDLWNVFPDPGCGEDIHNGEYFFERDYMSDTQVRKLKNLPGYITSQIDKVLLEETASTTSNSATRSSRYGDNDERKGRRVIWYYYGVLSRDEIDCCRQMAGRKPLTSTDVPMDKKFVHVIATMIGDTVVRVVLNPLDSGGFPYHVLPWQRRPGYWAGVGVAEQIRTPQRMLNAATRAMLNNAGKSSGSQIVVDQGAIRPANGYWGLEPDKIWYKTSDSPGDDVRKAFYAFDVPNMTKEMLEIIDFAEKQGENATSIPLVTQGQSGKTTPDTFGGMQLQDNNANQLLRSIGANTDDFVTEPLIRKMYEWLLLDPKVPNEEKGDFKIDAHGSSALVERAIQDQTLATIAPLVKDPAYGASPRKWFAEYLRSRRLDPTKIQWTDEEQQKLDSQPPPEDPRVTAAKIMAAANVQIKQGSAAADQEALRAEGQSNADEIAVRREELQTRLQIATLDYATKHGISLQQAKVQLAKTAMTLQAQRDLAAAAAGVDLHKHHNPQPSGDEGPGPRRQPRRSQAGKVKPLAQLPGKAAPGQAMTQMSEEPVE